MTLHLYNSLTDQKEEFVPLHAGCVTMYVCGPTVYNDSHLGHAKTYVSFDVILRYLRYRGFHTFYVQNITDVGHLVGDSDEGEDKLMKRARELKLAPMAVAETYTRRHFEAMDRMDVLRPDISPRATGHIPEQLAAIQSLVEQDLAYEVNGSVYFDVSRDACYGKLSNRSFEEMQESGRIKVRTEKQNPQDFALWKRAAPEHLMRWRDPYSGWGYPGWHTECTVMSTKYLGDAFDIHGGGMELKFPHHDCEISQARGLGKPFARYWLHNNMLTIDSQKMSKSTGNFITLLDAFEKHDPLAVRYFIAASHYRSVVDYSEHALRTAGASLKRLQQTSRKLREISPDEAKPSGKWFSEFRDRFDAAMDDDFSTPQAFAVLFELNREVNSMLTESSPNPEAVIDAEHLFSKLGGEVLGIIPTQLEQQITEGRMRELMQLLIDLRNRQRMQRDFETADLIRDQLEKIGINLKDSREGTEWES